MSRKFSYCLNCAGYCEEDCETLYITEEEAIQKMKDRGDEGTDEELLNKFIEDFWAWED